MDQGHQKGMTVDNGVRQRMDGHYEEGVAASYVGLLSN